MQQGGSQYGVPPPPPEMTNSFGGAATTGGGAAAAAARPSHFPIPSSDHLQQQPMAVEAVSPISSRPPQQSAASSSQQQPNYEELATTVSGSFPDDDAAGDEGERGPPGNRWPRHETLALIKIRTDMDAAFRDATLKGPLWEDVSRKLAEQGYTRSAKKCKEKFENVHKYYKRTKEGRAGRQDGKSYRFFSQLEALHNTTAATAATTRSFQHTPLPSVPPSPLPLPLPPSTTTPQLPISIQAPAPAPAPVAIAPPAELSFSTNSDTSCGSDSDEGLPSSEGQQQRKRKRGGGGGSSGSSRKTMSFFNELMRKVMEQQEAMQQRFLETIEKREQDRMIREEAWRRQEMARLAREHELMAQERTMAASRDAAVIAFLQKISAGQSLQPPQQAPLVTVAPPPPVPIVVTTTPTAVPPPPPPPLPPPAAQQATTPLPAQQATTPPPAQQTPPPQLPPPSQPQPQPHQQHQHQQSSPDAAVLPEQHHFGALASPVAGGSGGDLASSRWPKTEVHALINLRSGLDAKYQDAGPKGPLWEEISAGMRQMGYNRSAKRCKEKWENINKYFKKVKESNKKRPADAKTCPYFHQLDALYRQKSAAAITQNYNANSQVPSEVLPISTFPPSENVERKTSNGNGNGEAQRSNGGANKPEDTVKGAVMTMDNNNNNNHHHHRQPSATTEDYDDNEDEDLDDDEEEEDEEEQKMAYKIEYQRSNVGGAMSNGTGGNGPQAAAAATAGSFLAMVQ